MALDGVRRVYIKPNCIDQMPALVLRIRAIALIRAIFGPIQSRHDLPHKEKIMNALFVLADLANVVGDPIGLSVLYIFAMILWGSLAKYDRRASRRPTRRIERD